MDYFQNVVVDYLRANRSTFVNTECCVQINAGENPDNSGPHWYCDALAVDLKLKRAWLCEISYSKSLSALAKRLTAWKDSWTLLRVALNRDCGIPLDWNVRPWVFVPQDLEKVFAAHLQKLEPANSLLNGMPIPKVTYLEEVMPWKYKSWNRADVDDKN